MECFFTNAPSPRNDPWLKDLNNWIEKSDKELRMKNIQFVHYDSYVC